MSDANRHRAKALLKLKDGLSPREIFHFLKYEGEEEAHNVYVAAMYELGGDDAKENDKYQDEKLTRSQRRYWKHQFEKLKGS